LSLQLFKHKPLSPKLFRSKRRAGGSRRPCATLPRHTPGKGATLPSIHFVAPAESTHHWEGGDGWRGFISLRLQNRHTTGKAGTGGEHSFRCACRIDTPLARGRRQLNCHGPSAVGCSNAQPCLLMIVEEPHLPGLGAGFGLALSLHLLHHCVISAPRRLCPKNPLFRQLSGQAYTLPEMKDSLSHI